MSAVLRNIQIRAAAFVHDNACDCCNKPRDTRIDALVRDYKSSPRAAARADEWTAGNQSPEHYDELESAMADLHFTEPSDLLGSDLLTRLYRLAKLHGEARLAQFQEMAEQEVAA